MSESNGRIKRLLQPILDLADLQRRLDYEIASSTKLHAEWDAASRGYRERLAIVAERKRGLRNKIDAIEATIVRAIEVEARRMGWSPQSIVLVGCHTSFMLDEDGELLEYRHAHAYSLPAPPADEFPEPGEDDDDDQDFDLDDRIGLTPAGRMVGDLIARDIPEAVAPRVDGLSDEELMESAAYETLHDYVSPAAADAWRSLGSPLDGHAVAAMADEDGFVPASALGTLREAARAQAFAAIDNEVS